MNYLLPLHGEVNELQLIEQKANIVVGVANSYAVKIGVLLSKYSEYQVDYISSGE